MVTTPKILSFDCEATIHAKGNPFSSNNKLCCVGVYDGVESLYFDVEHSGLPYGDSLRRLREILESAELLVGFNIKYDMHWIRRYIPDITFPAIWDCQLGEFLLHDQRNPYPSLEWAATHYEIGTKPDIIATDYWNRGIDTDLVPRDVLEERVTEDARLTYLLYLKQKDHLHEAGKLPLFRTQCADAKVLAEMEYNGMRFDRSTAERLANETSVKLNEVECSLAVLADSTLVNWNSPHHVSAVLYGGSIPYPSTETVCKILKSGKVKQYERKCQALANFPRLVDPLPNTESIVKGSTRKVWSTAEPVLRSLRARGTAAKIIKLLLEQSELDKLRSTYYLGLPQLHAEMAWSGDDLHGTFNQCVARTGRLSSSKPNLQNFATAIKPLFTSRNGCLINTDAKGLEWVCAAYLSGDATAAREIWDGVDHHEENRKTFGLPSRLIAKVFMFRLIYGGGSWSYAHDPDFTEVSRSESFWQDVIDKTYLKYKGLQKWHANLVREVVDTGGLHMPTGRRYRFERVNGEWPRTQILNYPVQGFGADLLSIIRIALYKRMKKLNLQSLLVCTVHDSILIDAFENEKDIIFNLIEDVFRDLPHNFKRVFGVDFNLPLRCETSIGKDWGNMEVI